MDLLTIGDITIDAYMKIADKSGLPEGTEGIDKRICFFHGSKIPVEHYEADVAGNSLNVAIGCHKMGLKTSVYSEIGADANGERAVEELKQAGVDTKFCYLNEGQATNVNSVIIYGNDRTIFSYHAERKYEIKKWGKPKWIYYTSMGKGYEEFQKLLIDFVNTNRGVGVAFNPGTIQMKYGLDTFRNILEYTDILFVNREEAEKLVGKCDVKDLHLKLHELGPKLTVMTDSSNDSSCYDGTELLFQKIYSDERPIADKTGAGDAFAAGFISAIFYGKNTKTALKWGVVNAGSIIKEIGTTKGLLTKDEIEEIIQTI